jgi:hypothetical protein
MSSKRSFDVGYLLSCSIEDLASAIASMSADDCEKHARAVLAHVGGPSFEAYLSRILRTMVPDDGSPPPVSSDGYSGLFGSRAEAFVRAGFEVGGPWQRVRR